MHTTTTRRSRGGPSSGRRHSFSNSASKRRGFQSNNNPRRRPHSSHRRGGSSHTSRPARKMATFDPSRFINTNPVERVEEVYTPTHAFTDFGLDARLVKAISSMNLTSPTPIQDQIIPEILENHDVIGLAATGTGKTAAFLIPLIQNTLKNRNRQTLVLVPTRELAIQIEEELRGLSKGLGIYSVTCVGGMNIRPQINSLRRANHFIIGTPGRVLDLINRKSFRPEYVTTVVLDEADRMLDMGFIVDMRKILSGTPSDRETLLFSATTSRETDQIVHQFLRNPITVSVKKKDVVDSIEQDVVRHGHHNKFETLTRLFENPALKRVLIFGSMKHSVEKLSKQLSHSGINAESIHGNKSHVQRQRALSKFKNGSARVLVATDVAARGIHVDNVSHVINYDLPNTFEDYVHRIGRTGRASKRGKALTFVPESHR